ncbi:MAG: DNA mismatch repair endonuclease MutL [Gammaproteobacteria bacterium]|nr:DNA mismatch repair endonuclease MutL [Gammaproteobacteria bacterium]
MVEAAHEIRLLPDHVINQIAAGEVIERPASIVKELVENSLDAGARQVTVEVTGGGIDRIVVTDDGCGIESAQLPLAVTRHCTSKLIDADQLSDIATLGFRGEALASIAAVARMRVQSRPADQPHAMEITVNGGVAGQRLVPATLTPGTRIEINDLFFNAPPRRRFLKRPLTEYLHVEKVMKQMAFCHPQVRFTLINDDKPAFTLLPATDDKSLARRFNALFGKGVVHEARTLSVVAPDIAITGWVGTASAARSQNDVQFLAVNGRVVRDRLLSHAVRMAYGDAIPVGRHPCYALSLSVPGPLVDVNVHPTKAEVRFREPRQIHDAVLASCNRALQENVTPAAAQPVAEPRGGARYRFGRSIDANGMDAADIRLFDQRWLVELAGDGIRIRDAREIIRRQVMQSLWAVVADAGPVAMRPLLIPQPVRNKRLAGLVEPLAWRGFDFSQLGPGQLALRRVPVRMPTIDYKLFCSLLSQIDDVCEAEMDTVLADTIAAAWRPPDTPGGLRTLLGIAATLAPPVAVTELGADWPELLINDHG